jgi:predicted HAD superfamily Cof-like phosphohydrolase
MAEENLEYLEACIANDDVAIADALTDMLYILLGTMTVHGFQDLAKDCFLEVHRSNMSKLDENGKPIYREDGKILKSIKYSPPQLQKTITKTTLKLKKNAK